MLSVFMVTGQENLTLCVVHITMSTARGSVTLLN